MPSRLNFIDDLKKLSNPKNKLKFNIKEISKPILIRLYFEMLKIRKVEKKIAQMSADKIINTPVHLSIGQEAIAVAIAHNLKKKDKVFGNHRSHSHIISLGTSLKKLFSECLGKEDGLARGFGGSMHLIDKSVGFEGSVPIVGATIPIACGYSLANKLQKKNNICVTFFGDGACEEGVFHETLNFASLHNTPILFIVENNLFSSHLDINLRQPSNKISRFADAHKISSKVVDGNNVTDLYKQSKKIINYVRDKQKPFLLEIITYRHLGHVGPNKDIDVGVKRNKQELELWIKNKDPLALYEKFLLKKKIISNNLVFKISKSLDNKILNAIKFSINAKYPKKTHLEKFVYNEKH